MLWKRHKVVIELAAEVPAAVSSKVVTAKACRVGVLEINVDRAWGAGVDVQQWQGIGRGFVAVVTTLIQDRAGPEHAEAKTFLTSFELACSPG